MEEYSGMAGEEREGERRGVVYLEIFYHLIVLLVSEVFRFKRLCLAF
jgi:hypothetical protein